jgi:hypothetical protein
MLKLSVEEVYAEGSLYRQNDGPVRAADQPTYIAIYTYKLTIPSVATSISASIAIPSRVRESSLFSYRILREFPLDFLPGGFR